MSWFPNPFKSLHFSDDGGDNQQEGDNRYDAASPADGGVKDDFSAITESISRQFRGVAAFLAPPPPPESDVVGSSSSSAVAGIRSDLAEIGGTFKSTLSLFSNPNKAVSEITKFASDLLQLNEEDSRNVNDNSDENDDDEEEEEDEYGAGVADQVIEFARQVSDRPELWFDFPLSLDDHDFDMSNAQSEHAAIVEQMVPRLTDLKNRISSDKSERQFWMIYFILLLPRLNDEDLELLSTTQIIEARETLLMMLRMKNEEINSDNKVDDTEPEDSHSVGDVTVKNSKDSSNFENNESDITKKPAGVEDTVTSTQNSSSQVAKADKNADYLREEPAPSGTSTASKTFQTEDDVSFSDLEDDDSDLPNRVPSSGSLQIKRNSSTEGSTGWVRLNEITKETHVRGQSSSRDRDSEGDESTDWLTVDDF